MTQNGSPVADGLDIVGVIPAGGRAERISPLPCSKELFPVGFRAVGEAGGLRPKVAAHYLLEKMRMAGVSRVYIVLRDGKWDIPAYFHDGRMLGVHLAYLIMDVPFGVPFTLDQAYPFVRDVKVAFGFPDILFGPDDAFVGLRNRQGETGADVVLGLLPSPDPRAMDMVDVRNDGTVHGIHTRCLQTDLVYTWVIALWTPAFSHFMHEYLARLRSRRFAGAGPWNEVKSGELTMGEVIREAVHAGLHVVGERFPGGSCLDIGTPENLLRAVRDGSA